MSNITKLLEDLDNFSDELNAIGLEKNDRHESPIFFELSSRLDDIIMKYDIAEKDEMYTSADDIVVDDQNESRGC